MPTNCIHTDNQSKQESHVDEKHPLDEALGDIADVATKRRAACIAALEAELATAEPDRESRTANWIRTRIGEAHMHPRERAMRLLEEAIELSQAEGITIEQVQVQAAHVFARPRGIPKQEAAGIAVCLLGWCAATGNTFAALADQELDRIERKPIGQIRGSLARKSNADLVCTIDAATSQEGGNG